MAQDQWVSKSPLGVVCFTCVYGEEKRGSVVTYPLLQSPIILHVRVEVYNDAHQNLVAGYSRHGRAASLEVYNDL